MANAPAWLIDAFGVTAGCCSMLSIVTQIVKMVRERDAEGVSLKNVCGHYLRILLLDDLWRA